MKFPDMPRDGVPVIKTVTELINYVRASRITGVVGGRIKTTTGGTTIDIPTASKTAVAVKPNPFDVSLSVGGTVETPTYSVRVTDGWVNERIPGVNDPVTNASAVHKPHNILWGADGASQTPVKAATDRRSFPITVGQQVSVVVYVDAQGAIALPSGSTEAGPTKIAIESEDFKSIHYVPPRPIDSDVGIAGEYHYKLAVLKAADGTHSAPWLEIFLAGSHLDHFRDLPILDNLAGAGTDIGRVFKEYNKETNTYEFRAINTSSGQLTASETEDGIELTGNGEGDTLTVTIGDDSPIDILTWVDGLVTAHADFSIPAPITADDIFASGAHPWKCTAGVSDVIAVAEGKVLGITNGSGGGPFYFNYKTYVGGNVTVTANGWIYMVVSGSTDELIDDVGGDFGDLAGVSSSGVAQATRSYNPSSVTVLFSASNPDTVTGGGSGEIYIPIAEVALAGGVASVVDQVITHNPLLPIERASSI